MAAAYDDHDDSTAWRRDAKSQMLPRKSLFNSITMDTDPLASRPSNEVGVETIRPPPPPALVHFSSELADSRTIYIPSLSAATL